MLQKKFNRCIVALLLVLTTLLSPFSPVFATLIDTDSETLTATDIVSEDESKREQFSKHYLTGDGTYFAVSYSEQVNWQDDEGRWHSVDNSLSTNILTGEKTTRNEKYKVKFASKANKSELVTIKTSNLDVSFGITVSEDGNNYLSLNKVKVTENENNISSTPKTTKEAQLLGKATSSVIYKNAFSDYLDIRYTVFHKKVKEDIVLNRVSNIKSYKVTYNISNDTATATLNSDGSVSFRTPNSDTVLFKVGVPVMYDSANASSTEISVNMTQTAKTVEIIYTPSQSWLNSEERVYPVVIDPVLNSSQETTNIIDTVAYTSPINTSYYATAEELPIGEGYKTYIKILNVPTVPDYAELIGADLCLNLYEYNQNFEEDETGNRNIYLSQIVQDWNEYMFESSDQSFNDSHNIVYTPTNPLLHTDTVSYKDSIIQDDYDYISYYMHMSLPKSFWENIGFNNYFQTYDGFAVWFDEEVTGYMYSSEMEYYLGPVYRPLIVIRYDFADIDSHVSVDSSKVYLLKNKKSNKYLTFDTNTDAIYQYDSGCTTGSQLLKINYDTTFNHYTIAQYGAEDRYVSTYRLMHGSSVYDVFSRNVSNVVDSQWIMLSGENGIRIMSKLDYTYALRAYGNSNASPGNTNENSPGNIAITEFSYDNSYQYWELEEIESLEVDPTDKNTEFDFQIGTKILLDSNGLLTNWVSSNSQIALIDANGLLVTRAPGITTLRSNYGDTEVIMYVHVLPSDGIYYIKNSDSKKCMQLDNNVNSQIDGVKIELWNHDYDIDQMWELKYLDNGYFAIISVKSNLALTIPGDKVTDNNERLRQGVCDPNKIVFATNQQWRLIYQDNKYIIKNRASFEAGYNYILSPTHSIPYFEDANVINTSYTTYANKDYWELTNKNQVFTDFSNINEKTVYNVSNEYDYLTLDANNNLMCSDSFNINKHVTSMWRFESVWYNNKKYYKIYSMSKICGSYDNLLTYDIDGISIQNESSATIIDTLWSIKKIKDVGCYIIPAIDETKYLTRNEHYITCSAFSVDNSTWLFEELTFDQNIQANIWEGNLNFEVCEDSSGKSYRRIYCLVDSSWDHNLLDLNQIEEAINEWNGINDIRLEICTSLPDGYLYQSGNGIPYYYITLKTDNAHQVALGKTEFYINGTMLSSEGAENTNWDKSIVTLYTSNIIGNSSLEECQLNKLREERIKPILIHELGHALKISHIFEANQNDLNVGILEKYPSIMHNNLAEEGYTNFVTNFDKLVFIEKWGK